MSSCKTRAVAIAAALACVLVVPVGAQHQHGGMAGDTAAGDPMWSAALGGGWRVMGMAQAFPVVTFAVPFADDSPLGGTAGYLTQPVVMADVASGGAGFVVRATLNFEGLTQPDGERTLGGWGEGFIDQRHPHTLLHELVLSLNAWDILGGAASLSAGRGFAPYGTDDPMSRPVLKYPTNHHLSQILERWTLAGTYVRGGWSIEAGVFGGSEPDGPYDLSNIESFGDSWSARVARRWGGPGPLAAWEASLSYGDVAEQHDGGSERTQLWNAAVRHARDGVYALLEASRSEPADGEGYFSVLGEARLERGGHRPYARIEYATRPEFERRGAPGSDGFFRYDHDAAPAGATRWLIATAGYGYETTGYPLSVRPFLELLYHRVRRERGSSAPAALFESGGLWVLSLGARVFLGGDPMRMGAYGVLDAMQSGRSVDPVQDRGSGRGGDARQ